MLVLKSNNQYLFINFACRITLDCQWITGKRVSTELYPPRLNSTEAYNYNAIGFCIALPYANRAQ